MLRAAARLSASANRCDSGSSKLAGFQSSVNSDDGDRDRELDAHAMRIPPAAYGAGTNMKGVVASAVDQFSNRPSSARESRRMKYLCIRQVQCDVRLRLRQPDSGSRGHRREAIADAFRGRSRIDSSICYSREPTPQSICLERDARRPGTGRGPGFSSGIWHDDAREVLPRLPSR